MMGLLIALLWAATGFQVDTLKQDLSTDLQGMVVLQGRLYLDRGGGQLESLDGEILLLESPNPPLEVHSDGLRLYVRTSEGIVQFSALGRPLQWVLSGTFRAFSVQEGTALYALTWDGTDVRRLDFTGAEDLDLNLFEPAFQIFALPPDGFALSFRDRTVLYDPYGFPLDSLPFPVSFITRLGRDLVFLRDTLWITPQDTITTQEVRAAVTWQNAVYWVTRQGLLLCLRPTP